MIITYYHGKFDDGSWDFLKAAFLMIFPAKRMTTQVALASLASLASHAVKPRFNQDLSSNDKSAYVAMVKN
jgi:hypothetical protein